METESKREIIKSSYGEVLGQLRKDKHISQEVAAGGKQFQGNLSRFENGGPIPAADTFFRYLRNIKVAPSEYLSALNNHLINKDILRYIDEVGKAYTSQDAAMLKEIIKELDFQEESSQNYDKSSLDRIMVEAILSLIEPEFKIPSSDADKIRTYLKSTKYWGYYELRLFGSTSRLFDFFQLFKISERIIQFANKNKVSPFVKRQIILCELNILDSFLLQNITNLAKGVISYLEKYKIPEEFYYERATFVYFKARYDYLVNNENEQALETMKAHLSALELYGCSGTADLCRKEINNLINNPEGRISPDYYEDKDNEK